MIGVITGLVAVSYTHLDVYKRQLNMSMLNCFFSNQYKDRSDLFDSLSIWEDEDLSLIHIYIADYSQCGCKEAKRW